MIIEPEEGQKQIILMKDIIGQINVRSTAKCHGTNAPITNITVPPQMNVTMKMLEVRGRIKG